jgi:peptide/nickel transport system substrate-binding protein
MKAAAAKGKYRVYQTGSYLGVNYFCFNLRPGNNPEGKPYLKPAKLSWFQNLTFRQAIIQAIDRANMVDTVYSGYGEVIHGPISPANKRWFNENIFKYEYSREKSAALLDSLDMKDRNGDGIREDKAGNPVEFVLVTNAGSPTRSALGNIIASDLKEVGIKVTLQTLDFNVLIPKLTSSFDYEAVLLAFAQGGNPVEQANVIPSSGMMHTFNSSQSKPGTEWEATADTLFNKFLVSFSYPEQKKYWDEIQNIYAKNLGWFYLANENISVAVRDNFKNLKPASYAQFHNILWNAEEISRK